MKFRIPTNSLKILGIALCLAVLVGAWTLQGHWWPPLLNWVQQTANRSRLETADANRTDDEGGEDDGHGHDYGAEENAVELSAQAQKNIGLTTGRIELQDFKRTISVPALVTERPGKTHLHIATPMTGVITHVMIVKGEAVLPGKLLFEIRLTHEDLVQAQTNYLQTLGELDVENREIARLKSLTEGLIARKTILQREYQKDRLEALLRAQREALLLHGLTPQQVDSIAHDRKLLRKLQIFAPASHDDPGEIRLTNQSIQQTVFEANKDESHDDARRTPLVVEQLFVHKGQAVQAGDPLCVLANLSELFIEGQAFERDMDALLETANQNWTITAVRETESSEPETIPGLQLIYLDNEIDLQSRALRFYVALPNKIVRDTQDDEGHRFLAWKYKPGQRLQLRIPVEIWKEQIVLPAAAVAREGADNYVYVQHGKKLVQRPVHVKYRDPVSVVIDYDGSLFPDDVIAMSGAHEIQMELKKNAGEGAGGHAHHGHSH